MSHVILGSSPDASTVAYSSMATSPALVDKTNVVFQEQPKHNFKVEDGKTDGASILTQANNFSAQGDSAFKSENFYNSYLCYLKAKDLYEQLPRDISNIKKLVKVYYDLAWVGMEIRGHRRGVVSDLSWTLCMPLFWPFSLVQCARLKCCSNWVENETVRSYIDKGLELVNTLIQTIETQNKISMGSDKNSVPDQVRKELAEVYYQKAIFYYVNEKRLDDQCVLCFSNCCFEGTNGKTDASRFDLGTQLALLKQAKEWDPSNHKYEAEYNEIDAHMKRAVINVRYS